jgi:chemotaxis protein histidine kinase CheA
VAVQRKYLEMFLEEGAEIVSKLNQRILSLESTGADGDSLHSAMRLAHTLKGGAKMVGLDNVSRAAHGMESALKSLTGGGDALTPDASTRLLDTLDRIKQVIDLVASGNEGEALDIDPTAPAPRTADAAAPAAEPVSAPASKPPGGPGPAVVEGPTPRRRGADRVRVSVDKLDTLQNLVDDLSIQKIRIFDHMNQFRRAFSGIEEVAWEIEDRDLSAAEQQTLRKVVRLLTGRAFAGYLEELHTMDQMVAEIQDQVFDLRMVPLAEVLDEYHRNVRDLARELGKDVTLAIDGKFTEMDKRVLENVQAPLMHLVRNAVDHGIESREERVLAGKPAAGRVTIRAYHKGSAVVLEVEDDGRGLDPGRIRTKAVERGLLSDDASRALPVEELYYLLCEPGFSTRGDVTEVSGRGVGLDVVKVRVEKLQGSLVIQSENGRFTRFRMYLPLSVSTLSALIVRAGSAAYGLPSLFVDRCLVADTAQLEARGGTWVHAGRVLPVVSLARALGLEADATPDRTCLAVVQFRGRHMVLQVDALEEEREVVLKPLGNHLREVPYVLGVSFLADGQPVPVLNVLDIHARWAELEAICRFEPGAVTQPPTVLVVDDSMTTRHMEQNVLESLGYQVVQAADGVEAWGILQGRQVDLVLTDVEMPGMDGLELSRRIRECDSTAQLPVVAVSHQVEDADLEAGFLAGMDAYIRKDRFSQKELGATLQGLLRRDHA